MQSIRCDHGDGDGASADDGWWTDTTSDIHRLWPDCGFAIGSLPLPCSGLVAPCGGVMLAPMLAHAAVLRDVVLRATAPSPPTRRLYAAAAAPSFRSPAVTAMLAILADLATPYGMDAKLPTEPEAAIAPGKSDSTSRLIWLLRYHRAMAMMQEAEREILAPAVALFRGLADPVRLSILRRLAPGEARVVDLMRELGLAQSTVSAHLGCLRDCGLVDYRPEGRQSFYKLTRPELMDLLAAAEHLLAATGEAVALCPTYGNQARRK